MFDRSNPTNCTIIFKDWSDFPKIGRSSRRIVASMGSFTLSYNRHTHIRPQPPREAWIYLLPQLHLPMFLYYSVTILQILKCRRTCTVCALYVKRYLTCC
ncbi:hypothetical protein XELAEV_18006941mg [Xenopus laevis]|uniref:Uncharacterized protein n=1 Tax=Xenopus laevis TaxID=8355 RepID=A0A974DZK6_XENLA|nr:hypothetical protein XELAEV_18006941mg [Xenopus laevis]